MQGETDRRHGSYEPRDAVPIRDTLPSEVEITDCDVKGCVPISIQSGSPFTIHEQVGGLNILAEALACTQGDRQAAYGSPAENWGRTAKIAQAITGLDCLTPEVCVKVAIAMKQSRLIQTPGHRDSMVDLAGYAWVLSEVVNG